jgi:hypothetical protein
MGEFYFVYIFIVNIFVWNRRIVVPQPNIHELNADIIHSESNI